MTRLYWLSEKEWQRIEPLLPRGLRGAHRVDDRRVISGILHISLRAPAGGIARRNTALHDDVQTLQLSGQGIWLAIFKALTVRPERGQLGDRQRPFALAFLEALTPRAGLL